MFFNHIIVFLISFDVHITYHKILAFVLIVPVSQNRILQRFKRNTTSRSFFDTQDELEGVFSDSGSELESERDWFGELKYHCNNDFNIMSFIDTLTKRCWVLFYCSNFQKIYLHLYKTSALPCEQFRTT